MVFKHFILFGVFFALSACHSEYPSTPPSSTPPVLDRFSSTSWDRRLLQVEEQLDDGSWVPRQPLSLVHAFSVEKHALGSLDIQLVLEPSYSSAFSWSVRRRFQAFCPDAGPDSRLNYLFDSLPPLSWSSTLHCAHRTWRFTLAQSDFALTPPVSSSRDRPSAF